MAVDANSIAKQILAQAAKQGGSTWTAIQKTTPLYVKGYAQNLVDIAEGVASGEISQADQKMYVKNAELMLVMSIANTSQIVLYEVQTFIDAVINIVKGLINSKLPVPLL